MSCSLSSGNLRRLSLGLLVCLTVAGTSAEKAPGPAVQLDKLLQNMRPLTKTGELWLDAQQKAVVVGGEICLRAGALEMFACPQGTKEHESIVSVKARAQEVHAALLAAGAKTGAPVSFYPQFTPASGSKIEVWVVWDDRQGKRQQARAQDWILNVKTGKPMEQSWVFAGSGFWKDETTGQQSYQADGGDMICVSNFPTAMLDLPMESSQATAELLFMANTDRIPELGTKVRLVLTPHP